MRLTDEQLNTLRYSDFNVSRPVDLRDADLSKAFVYDRTYGFFYVGIGNHPHIMSMLLAFHHGYNDKYGALQMADELGIRWSSDTADMFLKTIIGSAFRSSQSAIVYAGKRNNLTQSERKFFGEVKYLFEE